MPEPNLDALEKALLTKSDPDKSFGPLESRGIKELLDQARSAVDLGLVTIDLIKKRLDEMQRLQSSFYNGQKP